MTKNIHYARVHRMQDWQKRYVESRSGKEIILKGLVSIKFLKWYIYKKQNKIRFDRLWIDDVATSLSVETLLKWLSAFKNK